MSREDEQRTVSSRKRNILYLIDKFLTDSGFPSTSACLKSEARLQPEYEICDNVDLDTIYLEYCSYFHLKFGKYPRIIKKTTQIDKKPIRSERKLSSRRKEYQKEEMLRIEETSPPALTESLKIIQMSSKNDSNRGGFLEENRRSLEEYENYSPEWKELADVVSRDLVRKNYGMKWCNIFGNSQAVSTIKEAVLVPLQFPHLFSETLKPWKSVLLHGPPGSGKTLIAKTLCSETFGRVAFFNVCASTITSKWRGESEKMIRVLFEVARFYAPAVIFIDEIEGLTSKRDSPSQHEASKRFKNEFLSLLDGMGEDNKEIFILANTNLPWEIDAAFLRRFEKRILVELPNAEERKQLIKFYLPECKDWPDAVLNELSQKCQGYTGDELRVACKEATMKQIRKMWTTEKPTVLKCVSEADVQTAIEQIQSNGEQMMKKHVEWNKLSGSK